MKKIVALLLFAGSFAVEATQELVETNVTKAMAIYETKKPLLLFFTGSDWCGWCIRLQKKRF
jgi:protein disulfide-isomerase